MTFFTTVVTNCGHYIGKNLNIEREYSVIEFLGINYGEAPVGNLRFEDPKPYKCLKGQIYLCEEYGPLCPQVRVYSSNISYSAIAFNKLHASEDCLSLNIWKPNIKGDLPVLVFFHGGDFMEGSGNYKIYNGAHLAYHGKVIVVTVNYRLNVFGFAQTIGGLSIHGNMGLKDQQLALQWIQKYIYYFGGDRHKVTIIGAEAGAASVQAHLFASESFGLYKSAIMFQGHMTNVKYWKPYKKIQSYTEEFIKMLGCRKKYPQEDLVCLRKKTTSQIVDAAERLYKKNSAHEFGSPFAISPYDLNFFKKNLTNEFANVNSGSMNINTNAKVLVGRAKNGGVLEIKKINYTNITSVYNPKRWAYYASIDNDTYWHILEDVAKRIKVPLVTSKRLDEFYKKYKDFPEKLIRLFSDLFNDCDLRKFVSSAYSLKQYPRLFMLDRPSSILLKEGYEWFGTTSIEFLEYILGNPYRSKNDYHLWQLMYEKKISKDIMSLVINFINNSAIDERWSYSDYDHLKERYINNKFDLKIYDMRKSKISLGICKLFDNIIPWNDLKEFMTTRTPTTTTVELKTTTLTNDKKEHKEMYFGNNGIVGEFLGIPYAKPPIGNLRFQNPQEPYCHNFRTRIVFDKYGKSCPQMITSNLEKFEGTIKKEDTSENCLYLNIWSSLTASRKPVLVFFHSGGFNGGSANLDIYNGSVLAFETKSIVITVNYRLNVFGFAQSTNGLDIPGNMGLKDQQMALKWIYKHIGKFDGDRSRVTIFGIGAGAASVSAHLLSEDSFKYYKGAILISGHMASVKYSKSYNSIQNYTNELINRLYCKRKYSYSAGIKCLRSKRKDHILKEALNIYEKTKKNEFGPPFVISSFDRNFFKRKLNDMFVDEPYSSYLFNRNARVLLGHTENDGLIDLLYNHYLDVVSFNVRTRIFDLKTTLVKQKNIFQDVVKKLCLKSDKRKLIEDIYSNYTKNKEKVIKLYSDLFTSCDLRQFTRNATFYLKDKPRVFALNKTSTMRSKDTFLWLGSTILEAIEYIFGNPFRHPDQYRGGTIVKEQGYSLMVYNDQYGNNSIMELLGIPYAKPPLDSLRFQNPQEPKCHAKQTKIVFDKYGKSCPQLSVRTTSNKKDYLNYNMHTSEDCLYLNVWVPFLIKSSPVIIFFHGGGFIGGSANLDMYNGSYLARLTQSIVVTVNYRLNVLGFAQSSGGSTIPGNMGLKDQQMALKWVHDNIEYFNGDRERILIFGIGAGAASVSAHLLAPESFKYYKRAMLLSGHMANAKYSKPHKDVQLYTEKLIYKLGCRYERKPNLELKCLRKKHVHDILNEAEKLQKDLKTYDFGSPFSISLSDLTFFKRKINNKYIDKPHTTKGFNIHAKVILGHNGNDGVLDLLDEYFNDVVVYNTTTKIFDLTIKKKIYENILDDLIKKLKIPFLNKRMLHKAYSNSTRRERVMRMFSDIFYNCDLKEFTFDSLYLKNFQRGILLNKTSAIKTKKGYLFLGATKIDAIDYIFGNPFRHPEQYPKDKLNEEQNYSHNLIKLIGSFANKNEFQYSWNNSDYEVYRERMANETFNVDKVYMIESPIQPLMCKLLSGTVVVTVNYRLNVFGFAQSQGAYYIPGNMGLKDQQMALKWINKNIKYFNGDKRKVTILGIGSGAASVSAHLMVKESFGLYKKAIMFSGHMANVKYSKSYRTVQDYTEKLINRLKCQKNQLKCLSKLSTHKIMNEASKLYKQMSRNEFGSPFSISLFDKTFFKGHINNKYINLYTFNSYTKILVGHTKNEGSLALLSGLYSYVFVYNSKKWKYDIIVDNVSYKAILNDVVKKLNLKVNNWSTINETYSNYAHNADKIIRLLSDLFNDCDLKTFTFIANQRLKNKIRVLLLDKAPSSLFEEKYEVFGTTPQDIIEYLFGYPFRHPNHYRQNNLEDEKNYSLKLMEFISNFTKTYTFDENWKSSDKNIFRERMVNETLSWNKYIILESPLNTNSCKILKDF
uniref:acetylcholinesterase n=1 Tax=Parastrongyloides trichosuri TaxID=131310 RepID=A0A0N4ZI24_PARTI